MYESYIYPSNFASNATNAFLHRVWNTVFIAAAEKYVREVVNQGGVEDEAVDSDGEAGIQMYSNMIDYR